MDVNSEIGKYQILNHLGKGHFGDVYLANDRALNAIKALKVLDIENPHEFMKKLEEAQLLHKCRHKHIVAINEANIYEIESSPKIVIDMEYITGGSLEKYLQNNFLSIIEATKYLRDILFGLEYLHSQNVLHRDIKPANIMLTGDLAKLSDFGLATSAGESLIGSPHGYIPHCAPEMFTGTEITGKTTVQTDIFATGITYYRMVSNLANWREILSRIEEDKVFPNGEIIEVIGFPRFVSRQVQRIIKKASNSDPNKRFQSAVEMRQAIEKLRSNINWKFVDENLWQGYDQNGNLFAISVSPSNEFVAKKNKRKITDDCRRFDTTEPAICYMHEYVAKTTFQ
jgi:serine/threonine-protein kinase